MGLARLAAASLLGSLLALPVVPAQAGPADQVTTLPDAENDVATAEFCFLGVPGVCTEHLDPKADLVRVDVHDDGTLLTIDLATRTGDDVTLSEGQQYRTFVDFRAGGLAWELRADHGTRTPGFQLWQMAAHEGGSLGGAEGFSGFEHSGLLAIAPGSEPWDYSVGILLSGLLVQGVTSIDRISDLHAVAYAYQSGTRPPSQASTRDVAPDEGPLPEHRLAQVVSRAGTAADGTVRMASDLVWSTAKGTDFAGGTSVAVGPDGPATAYYVYRDERGAQTGVYYAERSGPGLDDERIAGFTPPAGDPRDGATRTYLAFAGNRPVVLFAPAPWTGAGYRIAVRDGGSWTVADPAAGLGLAVADGQRNGAAIAASAGRTVLALPLAGDRLAVLAAADPVQGGWQVLATLDQARLPRLALDAGGKAHLASFQLGPDDGRGIDLGWLRYASEASGWDPSRLVEGVEDRTRFWETAETDGSYAMALDGALPCFAWDATGARDGQQGFGCLRDGRLQPQPASFEPIHGNPQLTMRMAFDAAGHAYVASGYGGSDLVAMRRPDGSWATFDIDRRDMFDMAVAPDGTVWMAYTEPHGGTTVALAGASPRAIPSATALDLGSGNDGPSGEDSKDIGSAAVDTPSVPAAAALMVLAALAATLRRRRP